jgi:hypothetical protein
VTAFIVILVLALLVIVFIVRASAIVIEYVTDIQWRMANAREIREATKLRSLEAEQAHEDYINDLAVKYNLPNLERDNERL